MLLLMWCSEPRRQNRHLFSSTVRGTASPLLEPFSFPQGETEPPSQGWRDTLGLPACPGVQCLQCQWRSNPSPVPGANNGPVVSTWSCYFQLFLSSGLLLTPWDWLHHVNSIENENAEFLSPKATRQGTEPSMRP